jgi:tyrosine decarboxylase/aspartate 1-decarboxylase
MDISTKTKNRRKDIFKELDTYRQQDFFFSRGHILGSMCTQPHPIAKQAYSKFLDTNLGDPELFPGTKEIESKLLRFILNLLHAPHTAAGQIVSGGTEGNITAMWVAKQVTGRKDIIVPASAHFSFTKIASLMDMKLVIIPLTKDCTMDTRNIGGKITKNTAAVVGVAGSTELGTVDPIPELSDLCSDEHLFLHVDAAFGGFVIPFLKQLGYDVPAFDFQLPGVSSVSIDAHKMGYSAIPLGTLVLREEHWLDEISVKSPCISSERQVGILGTRSGGPVAGSYAVARYLGNEGYKKVVERCMNTTHYAEKKITELGIPLVVKPTMNVLGVKLRNLSPVVTKLADYGWKVNKIDHLSCIRLVIMPHVTKKVIDRFIPVFKRTCEEVGEL